MKRRERTRCKSEYTSNNIEDLKQPIGPIQNYTCLKKIKQDNGTLHILYATQKARNCPLCHSILPLSLSSFITIRSCLANHQT